MTQGSPSASTPDARATQGNIAARIDRLPLTRIQYLIAGITQFYWGILIDTDGLIGKLYPFVWEPRGITTFQFSMILAANIGAGILVGQYAGGFLSDKYGRKRILVFSALVDAFFLLPIAFTYDFWWLLLWNFLYGIGVGMMLATNNVLLHEIAPPAMRHRLAMRTQLLTAVCATIPGFLGIWFVPDNWEWFIFVLVFLQLFVVTPLGILFLPESPRWLESKGRVEEADAIVSRWETEIERRTGPLPPVDPTRNPVVTSEKVPIRELFGSAYGKRTVLLAIIWSLAYGGMVYGAHSYLPTFLHEEGWSATDIFLWVTIIAAVVRVVMFYGVSFTGEHVERKHLLVFFAVLTGLGYLAFLLFDGQVAQTILVLIVYPAGGLWLFNMYNYTSTSFPTRFRAAGYAWTNGVGHTAAVWAPLLIAPLFTLTASQGHWGWLLWVALPGALLPAFLIGRYGINQKGRTLEETAT